MKRSIVMVEWSRDNEPTHGTRDEFLWHQMLLSLLYDEVLAQDETLVCSNRMARWFPDNDSFRLLEEIFECGGLAVLKRPLERYPEDLKERASTHPINARREHLARFSVNNDGTDIKFKTKRLQFHNRLEVLLAGRPGAHRHAGTRQNPDSNLMQEFARLLAHVLTDSRYESWLKSKFKQHITRRIAEEFVQYIDNPALAIDRLKEKHPDRPPKFTPQSGKLEFSTALAVQVASTYPPDTANALQALIEMVFARPFCQEEGAEGRYGQLLRDLPLASGVEETEDARGIHVVRVETTALRLPEPGPNFSKIINTVREKESGKNLRRAMIDLGPEPTFASATKAWRDVAADLASEISSAKMREIKLQTVAVETGRGVACGVLAGGALGALIHGTDDLALPLMEATLAGFAGPLIDVVGTHFCKSALADSARQRITGPLENAVKFSCVRHPTIKAD